MQRVPRGETLDGSHLALVNLRRQDQACTHELAVQPDRARAALALLARVLRTRERQMLAQEVQEARAGPHVGLAPLAVHVRADEHQAAAPARRSASAHTSARRASTETA